MDTQELEKLYSLKEKGIITEEQFNQKRQQILGLNKFNYKPVLKKYKDDFLKSLFYFLSGLSFLFLWATMAVSPLIFDYKSKINAFNRDSDILAMLVPLLVAAAVFCLLGWLLRAKLSAKDGFEKFAKNSKVYNKIMLILTIVLLVICSGLDIYYYQKNNGVHKEYYANGQLRRAEQYKKGECVGVVKEYSVLGQLNAEKTCGDTLLRSYYENGNLKADYTDGVKEYYENGKLKVEYTKTIAGTYKTSLYYFEDSFFAVKVWEDYNMMVMAVCSNDGEVIDYMASNDVFSGWGIWSSLCKKYKIN